MEAPAEDMHTDVDNVSAAVAAAVAAVKESGPDLGGFTAPSPNLSGPPITQIDPIPHPQFPPGGEEKRAPGDRRPSSTVVIEVSEKAADAVSAQSAVPARYPFLTSSRRTGADINYIKFAEGQGWLPHRAELFERSTRLLEEAHLAKLTHRGTDNLSVHSSPHELALITLHTSRAAERLRSLFCEIGWHLEDAPWLNAALLDNLDRDLAEEYVDMLRHLRLKCPEIMQSRGLLDGRGSRKLNGNVALRNAIAAPPDQVPLKQSEPKYEFSSEPIIVLAPGEHSWSSSHLKGWKERLATLGKVVSCAEAAGQAREIPTLARNLLRKVRDVKQKYPNRPLVLLGISVGAKVAIMVSFKERVNCLVCLGLQLQGIAGNDAVAVDTRDLFQLRPPTLFAIGSQSRLCPVSLMEQVRLQMIARNKLVIIRDADENLRIPLSKRLKVKLTQTMSDQLVLHQIGSFIQDSLKRTVRIFVEITEPGSEAAAAPPKVLTMEVMPSDTIAALKAKIGTKAGFAVDDQSMVMVAGAKMLPDSSTLAEHSIRQDARLSLVPTATASIAEAVSATETAGAADVAALEDAGDGAPAPKRVKLNPSTDTDAVAAADPTAAVAAAAVVASETAAATEAADQAQLSA